MSRAVVARAKEKNGDVSLTRRHIAVIAVIVFIVALFGVGALVIYAQLHQTVTLEADAYGDSAVTDISVEEYQELVREHKSFVLMIDNAGCTTTVKMRQMLANFSTDYQFKYYRMMWPEAKTTDIYNYVKFYPSIIIYQGGKVKAYLRADADEDAEYYNNPEALQTWLKRKIAFPSA